METRPGYPHIVVDEKGAVIEGTTLKVVELVAEHLAYGWSPEEICLQHPYLTLGQVYAALAYYWDHAEKLDKETAERLRRVDALKEKVKSQPSALLRRLKAQGRL
jgi:uncharacterized protein (DUF433 family)